MPKPYALLCCLTHWCLIKIVDILHMTYQSQFYFQERCDDILIQIPWKFVPKGLVYIKSTLTKLSHYLNQGRHNWLTLICATWPRCVITFSIAYILSWCVQQALCCNLRCIVTTSGAIVNDRIDTVTTFGLLYVFQKALVFQGWVIS